MNEPNILMDGIMDLDSTKGRPEARKFFNDLKDEEKGDLIGSPSGWVVFRYFGTDAVLATLLKLSPEVREKTCRSAELAKRLYKYLGPTPEQEKLLGELFKTLSPETLASFRKTLDNEQEEYDMASYLLQGCEKSESEIVICAPKINPRLYPQDKITKSKNVLNL
ncbi:MAG: hypothetical protein WC521_03675 [Bdellovibrionales bacterium]